MNNHKTYRLWQPVSFSDNWANCDTSVLDDIAPSWFRRRAVLENKSKEYANFLEELKREHAIETGVIERLYDLDKGITETFIKAGFVQYYLSHGDTNIPPNDLMRHLNDHLDAVNFVFDVVKENRPLTTGFIKELHHLTTRHQKNAAGRNQFGEKIDIPLLKGAYKVRENNPTRYDGTVICYAPPEHVATEMDNLVKIYNELVEKAVHPVIISAWFHHAFTTIHPFQDGNGRVARLLASLIFIKFGYFPITVLREEAKEKYYPALREADEGKVEDFVAYFCEMQERNIKAAKEIDCYVYHYAYIIEKQIQDMKSKFEFVYQILHPWYLNPEGPKELYHEEIEEVKFLIKLDKLLQQFYPKSLHSLKHIPANEEEVLEKIIDGTFSSKYLASQFKLKYVGQMNSNEKEDKFMVQYKDLMRNHFEKDLNWDYYTEDHPSKNIQWNWQNISWKDLCKMYNIPFSSSIRFSDVWQFFINKGYPQNIRFPSEWIEIEPKKKIEQICETLNLKFEIFGNHDAYVTILGSSKNIKKQLIQNNFEFTKEY